MLAVSQGRIILLSTPFGKRGFFFKEWIASTSWKKVMITADQCSRISPDILDEERLALGEWWFQQEYFCIFGDNLTSVFCWEDIQRAFAENVETWDLDSSDSSKADSITSKEDVEQWIL